MPLEGLETGVASLVIEQVVCDGALEGRACPPIGKQPLLLLFASRPLPWGCLRGLLLVRSLAGFGLSVELRALGGGPSLGHVLGGLFWSFRCHRCLSPSCCLGGNQRSDHVSAHNVCSQPILFEHAMTRNSLTCPMPRCGEKKRRQNVACVARQNVAHMTRQNVAVRLFAHNKTVPCFFLHRLVATNWLQKGLHRDGLQRGAGDGARTRDSLLGRQGVAESPLARYRLAIGADRTGISEIHATLTKTFAFPWQKVSRPFPDGIRMPWA